MAGEKVKTVSLRPGRDRSIIDTRQLYVLTAGVLLIGEPGKRPKGVGGGGGGDFISKAYVIDLSAIPVSHPTLYWVSPE